MDTNDQIINTYSDTLFFLDEAHRLKGYTVAEQDDKKPYRSIWILLHLIKRSKIVIATATPLIIKPNDFVPLINLILPMDRQLTGIQPNLNLEVKQLEPAFRGKISFVRALDTGIEIQTQGSNIPYTHVIQETKGNVKYTSRTIMDDRGGQCRIRSVTQESQVPEAEAEAPKEIKIQSTAVIKLLEMKGTQLEAYNKEAERIKDVKEGLGLAIAEIGIFVFPDGSYGKEGFRNNVINNKLKQPDIITTNLSEFSTKYNFFIKNEVAAGRKDKPGNVFCYLEDVRGSGVNLLGILLELFGFEKFNRGYSVFPNGVMDHQSFAAKKRFVLITSDTPADIRSAALEVFNSKENMYGQYIQIMVASKAARDGINVSNVKRGYIMSPTWHEAGMYQAQSRFIRATSHDDLKLANEDLTVKIYRLASHAGAHVAAAVHNFNLSDDDTVSRESASRSGTGAASIAENNKWSSDVSKYINAEKKDIVTNMVLREMKKDAFDYILNFKRNHRDGDKEFTKETDFRQQVSLQNELRRLNIPDLSKRDNLIQNTKKILYNKENIDKLEQYFNKQIKEQKVVSQKDISEWADKNNIEQYYIHLFKEQIKRKYVTDELGQKQLIEGRGHTYYNIRVEQYSPADRNILLIEKKNVQESEISKVYSAIKEAGRMEEYIRDYMWPSVEVQRIEHQAIMQRILEDCIIRKTKGTDDDITLNILLLFRHYTGYVGEYPLHSVQKVKEQFAATNKRAGRKAKETSPSKLKDIVFEKKGHGDAKVYYHFFEPISAPRNVGSIFSIKAKEVKIRILKHNASKFEYADKYESPVFQEYRRIDITKWQSHIENACSIHYQTYYGTRLRDSEFRIVEFGNKQGTGLTCKTGQTVKNYLQKITLGNDNTDILLNIFNPGIRDELLEIRNYGRERIFKLAEGRLTEDINAEIKKISDVTAVRRVYFWNAVVFNKVIGATILCSILMKFLKAKNLVLSTL